MHRQKYVKRLNQVIKKTLKNHSYKDKISCFFGYNQNYLYLFLLLLYNKNMNKNNKSTNKNFILTGADGGTLFTLAVGIPLIVALIFSIALISLGLNNEEFTSSPTYQYLSFAISSFSLFIVLWYVTKKRNLSIPLAFSLKRCNGVYLLIALGLAFGSLFGLGGINEWFINILQGGGYEISQIVLPKRHFGDYILCVIIVCLLPALLEECVFRGLLLNGARRGGAVFAVIVCGILFSIFHKNPAQTAYQLIIGLTLTLLAIKSGSIIPSVLYHFVNNLYVVTYYFLAPDGYVFDESVQIVLCVLGVIIYAVCLLYLIFKCKLPSSDEKLDNDYAQISNNKQEMKYFLLFSAPGIVACIMLWVVNLLNV